MTLTLSCTIMHAAFDPARQTEVERIKRGLDMDRLHGFEVVADHVGIGPAAVSEKAWRRGLEMGATHHMVLQDDVILCERFTEACLAVAGAIPHECLSLFYGPRRGFDGGLRWGVCEGPWGQGIIMPRDLAQGYLDWAAAHLHPDFRSSDARISVYLRAIRRQCFVPFPHLLEHADVKSTIGNRKGRKAGHFIGDVDPLSIDWTDEGVYMQSLNSLDRYNKWIIR